MARQSDEAIGVWPRPQEVKVRSGGPGVAGPWVLKTVGSADWLDRAAAQAVDVVNKAAGKTVAKRTGWGQRAIAVSTMETPPDGVKAVTKPQGYALAITDRGIHLAGADAAGVFYGAQTLGQLFKQTGDGRLAAQAIRDWPRFAMRGAHVFVPARKNLDFFRRFLDFLASVKCNTLFIEIGGGMQYDKHPEINTAWRKFCKEALSYNFDQDKRILKSKRRVFSTEDLGFNYLDERDKCGPPALELSRYFPKDATHTEIGGGDCLTKVELRRIVRECSDRHIEIIPEVQSLSHCYYLCCAHPEIAEHPEDPWPDTYCPSNPKSYELLFDVMEEVIELFKPRFMSIGHDEFYLMRICSRCRKRNAHEILAQDITRIHNFLTDRGVRTMMWGDKLMKITTEQGRRYGGITRYRRRQTVSGGSGKWLQSATYKAARMIPKDIVILDWYWSLDSKSERNFRKEGFETMYGNFWPMHFDNWKKRSNVSYVHGAEISTWCDVSESEFGHNDIYYRFFPGSDMLWHGSTLNKNKLCQLMSRWMTPAVDKMTQQNRFLVSGGAGHIRCVDISTAAKKLPKSLTRPVKCSNEVTTVLGTGNFSLITTGGTLAQAIVLGSTSGTRSVTIRIDGKAQRFLVLHGTTMQGIYHRWTYYSYHHRPAELVRYRVNYVDGKRRDFSGVYREDIGHIDAAWPNGGCCYRAVPVELDSNHTFCGQEWLNPRPDSAIKSLTISLGPDGTNKGHVVIAAVSVVE